jgi:hypothetical protein
MVTLPDLVLDAWFQRGSVVWTELYEKQQTRACEEHSLGRWARGMLRSAGRLKQPTSALFLFRHNTTPHSFYPDNRNQCKN